MKKLVLIGFILLTIPRLAFADEISDLKAERDALQQRLVEYQQVTQNISVKLIELNGIIQYLETQKKKVEVTKPEPEGKED